MDTSLNFIRRINENLQLNFHNIDYRSTCTATSLGTLSRSTTAEHDNDFVNIDISNIKLYNIFIDTPASNNYTITIANNLTYGITDIYIQLSAFTGSITLGFDKLKCISFYGTLSTDIAVPDGSSYIDYYNGIQK